MKLFNSLQQLKKLISYLGKNFQKQNGYSVSTFQEHREILFSPDPLSLYSPCSLAGSQPLLHLALSLLHSPWVKETLHVSYIAVHTDLIFSHSASASFVRWCPSSSAFYSICGYMDSHLLSFSITTFMPGSLSGRNVFFEQLQVVLNCMAICSSVSYWQVCNVPAKHCLLFTKENWSRGEPFA